MDYLIATALALINAVFLLLVAIGLPGTWLMLVTTGLVAWWRWEAVAGQPLIGLRVLIVALILALLGELLEFLAGIFGSSTAGGTRHGAIGALLGGLIGGIVGTVVLAFLPLIGSLIGACLGATIGAWGMELWKGGEMRASFRSGMGAGVGRLLGTAGKLYVGIIMWVLITVAAFWS